MWSSLSTRQRRVLIGLGLANLTLLIVAGTFVLTPEPETSPIPTPTLSSQAIECRTIAARLLADHEVAGTIAVYSDGSIEFVIGGDDPTAAWDSLAVSVEMTQRGCGPYDPIRVDVPDPSRVADRRLVVEARWIDVLAWSQGQIDDAKLSDRSKRTSYTRHPSAAQP
jgi:hypothetical protein